MWIKISPEGVKTGLAVMSTAGWREVSISGAPTVWSISTAQLLSAGKKGQKMMIG